MNLLAHAYLSQHHPQLLVGNMIGDDVKGMQIQLYPPGVRAGIQLHRHIDSFTDQHPLISEAKNIYRPAAGLYAGPLLDITLDFFLARDTSIKSARQWQAFAQWAYRCLSAESSWHVGGFRRYFPYMEKQNWLIHYGELPFIENAMGNLLIRVGKAEKKAAVLSAFQAAQPYLDTIYQAFFPALSQYARQQANTLLEVMNVHK